MARSLRHLVSNLGIVSSIPTICISLIVVKNQGLHTGWILDHILLAHRARSVPVITNSRLDEIGFNVRVCIEVWELGEMVLPVHRIYYFQKCLSKDSVCDAG